MLKKYKNQIYKFIADSPLSINDFNIIEPKDKLEESLKDFFTLIYKDTPMSFYILVSEKSHKDLHYNYTIFDKGYPRSLFSPSLESQVNFGFNHVLNGLKQWFEGYLKDYIEEQESADYWEQIKQEKIDFSQQNINFDDNAPFTEAEKESVTLGLNEAKILLLEKYSFSDGQMEIINKRFDYLEKTIDRALNKTDWKNLAQNVIIGLILNLTTDTNMGSAIYNLFIKVFNNIPNLPTDSYPGLLG